MKDQILRDEPRGKIALEWIYTRKRSSSAASLFFAVMFVAIILFLDRLF